MFLNSQYVHGLWFSKTIRLVNGPPVAPFTRRMGHLVGHSDSTREKKKVSRQGRMRRATVL